MLKALAILIIGFLTGYLFVMGIFTEAANARESVDNAVILVADMSQSMDEDEKSIARQAHVDAIVHPEIIAAIRAGAHQKTAFAYIEFSTRAHLIVDWTVVDDISSARAFSQQIETSERPPGLDTGTSLGEALGLAFRIMQKLPYEAWRKVVDIAGDGTGRHGTDPAIPRQMLLDMGATINGMPMDMSTVHKNLVEYYQTKITGGSRSFTMPLRNITDMPDMIRRKLILELM